MPQPQPPAERGKPSPGATQQPGATATSRGSSTHMEPPSANSPRGGGSQRNGDTPCEQSAAPGSGHCSCHAFCWLARMVRAGLPGLPSSCWERGGGLAFLFSLSLSLSWELIVHFQQQQGDPGDNSGATRPGTGTTWTRFRHLASRKEGGRQRRSIPSAPKANKLHRLTPAATETCRNDLGSSKSHREKLHVFLSFRRWLGSPLCRGEPWGQPPFAPSLRCPRPNPPGAHTGARGPKNLPAPPGSLLRGDKH